MVRDGEGDEGARRRASRSSSQIEKKLFRFLLSKKITGQANPGASDSSIERNEDHRTVWKTGFLILISGDELIALAGFDPLPLASRLSKQYRSKHGNVE